MSNVELLETIKELRESLAKYLADVASGKEKENKEFIEAFKNEISSLKKEF